jgi:hypothetical protein
MGEKKTSKVKAVDIFSMSMGRSTVQAGLYAIPEIAIRHIHRFL